MNIALFLNLTKKRTQNIAAGIVEFFQTKNINVFLPDSQATELNAAPLSKAHLDRIDFILSMGGDGTILRIAHQHQNIKAPILGINTGHLGFMADVPIASIYPSLQDLIDKKFTIQSRLVLEAEIKEKNTFAINDIVIHRGHNPSLIEIAVHVDGNYLNTFEADGIIIATPNGSTAYSLAAGGPIVSPYLKDACVITPISPHTISNRPIVLSTQGVIQIQYLSQYEPVEITADGVDRFSMKTGESIRIKKRKEGFALVALDRHDYFATLRSKLNWSGKLR